MSAAEAEAADAGTGDSNDEATTASLSTPSARTSEAGPAMAIAPTEDAGGDSSASARWRSAATSGPFAESPQDGSPNRVRISDTAARAAPGRSNADDMATASDGDETEARTLWVDSATSGSPWGSTVEGLLTFRGNPTRSYYGRGPVPADPQVLWRFPDSGALCRQSTHLHKARVWCGTGWTGQPAVFERAGQTWVAVGAFSGNVHFLNTDTGERLMADFETGDIIKGSVTIDPDGYPLLYTGSRDNKYRVIAFDGDAPRELWALDAYEAGPIMWNDDWDGAGLVVDDFLLIGGENSRFYVVRLNRGYDAEGAVTVDPHVVFETPGWDRELFAAAGSELSIENSVAMAGSVAYFANSGGLIQGWDLSPLVDGTGGAPERVLRFWAGDDIDASLVIDAAGHIYAGVEYQRGNARSREVGQILKLDPARPDNPLIWSVDVRGPLNASGVWATPGLHRDVLIVPTHTGQVHGIDTETGQIRWTVHIGGPVWPSPAIVDDVWVQGACNGWLYGFDVSDTSVEPPLLWKVDLGACIESTPAIWDGLIVVGTKGGHIYGLADPKDPRGTSE